jgi:hypothetical protein
MRRWNRQLFVALIAVLSVPGVALAQLETSTSYSMNESQIGGNGLFNSGSTHYNVNPATDDGGESLGASTVGNSASTHYQTNAGFDATAQPGLIMTINTGTVNFGAVTPGTPATATATFDVSDYTSYGYVVTIVGNPPTMGSHQISNLTTDTASNSTVEQFGLNAVANTGPVAVGANPLQVADNVAYPSVSKFGFGRPGTGTGTAYAQTNMYRYNSNDSSPVASSAVTTGDTKYTLSFLLNTTSTTPGGTYTGNLSIVATGTY